MEYCFPSVHDSAATVIRRMLIFTYLRIYKLDRKEDSLFIFSYSSFSIIIQKFYYYFSNKYLTLIISVGES